LNWPLTNVVSVCISLRVDACREKQCDFHSACVTDGRGNATCVCPSALSCQQVRRRVGSLIDSSPWEDILPWAR